MAKKKTLRRAAIKKLKGQRTVIVKTLHPANETLFPEKLKMANDLLARMKEIKF